MSVFEQFRKVLSDKGATDPFQDNVIRSFRAINGIPILDGVWLQNIALSATVASVAHGLGRLWRGYIVTRAGANGAVYEVTASAPDKTKWLYLKAGATGTYDLWVF